MLKVSKITGKAYHPNDMRSVVYISNIKQVGAYIANGGDNELLDIFYDSSKPFNRLTFVFEINDVTRALYEAWNRHELDY